MPSIFPPSLSRHFIHVGSSELKTVTGVLCPYEFISDCKLHIYCLELKAASWAWHYRSPLLQCQHDGCYRQLYGSVLYQQAGFGTCLQFGTHKHCLWMLYHSLSRDHRCTIFLFALLNKVIQKLEPLRLARSILITLVSF